MAVIQTILLTLILLMLFTMWCSDSYQHDRLEKLLGQWQPNTARIEAVVDKHIQRVLAKYEQATIDETVAQSVNMELLNAMEKHLRHDNKNGQ